MRPTPGAVFQEQPRRGEAGGSFRRAAPESQGGAEHLSCSMPCQNQATVILGYRGRSHGRFRCRVALLPHTTGGHGGACCRSMRLLDKQGKPLLFPVGHEPHLASAVTTCQFDRRNSLTAMPRRVRRDPITPWKALDRKGQTIQTCRWRREPYSSSR